MRPTKTQIYFLAGFWAIAAIVTFYLSRKEVAKNPYLSDKAEESRGDSELLNIQESIEHYRHEIRRNPDAANNYIDLARLKLQQARITGDDRSCLQQARRLIDQALSKEPNNDAAMITQAAICLNYHHFEEAKSLAHKVVARNSHNAYAWGVYSDALKELGQYDAAVAACDKMLSLRPDLSSYSRAAHLREIHGNIAGAKSAMKLAVNAGIIGLESHAWALYQLGNLYLNEGKLDSAKYLYEAILKARPQYPFALEGLAQALIKQKQYRDAEQYLLSAYNIAPEHQFMEELVSVYRLLKQDKKAETLANSVLQTFDHEEKQGWNINLEYARFCLKNDIHPAKALERARKEYDRRPDHIEVLEIYAWALHKNGRRQQAAALLKQALERNQNDATLCYLAGIVQMELGHGELANRYLERAAFLNPYVML